MHRTDDVVKKKQPQQKQTLKARIRVKVAGSLKAVIFSWC